MKKLILAAAAACALLGARAALACEGCKNEAHHKDATAQTAPKGEAKPDAKAAPDGAKDAKAHACACHGGTGACKCGGGCACAKAEKAAAQPDATKT